MKVNIMLSQKYAEQQFAETGKRMLNRSHAVELDEATLTPEQRQVVVDWRATTVRMFGNTTLCTYSLKTSTGPFSAFKSEPCLQMTNIEFDVIPTTEAILAAMQQMITSKIAAEAELVPALAAYKAEREAAAERRAADQIKRDEEKKLAAEQAEVERKQRRADAANIDWKPEGTAIFNLLKQLAHRATGESALKWAKHVVGIDPSKSDGWMFGGEFIQQGMVEIDNTDKVFLVATDAEVYLITLTTGKLVSHVKVQNSKGWALVIRDRVKEELSKLPVAKPEFDTIAITPEVQAVMRRAAHELELDGDYVLKSDFDVVKLLEKMTAAMEANRLLRQRRGE